MVMDDGSCHDDRINRSYHADHIKPKIIVAATHYMTPRIEWSPAAYCNAWQDTGKSCPRASCSCASWAARCCCSAARTSPTQNRPPPIKSRIKSRVRWFDGKKSTWQPFKLRLFRKPPHLRARFSTTIPSTSTWHEILKSSLKAKKYFCQCYIYS